MKKVAMLLAVMMILGTAPGWAALSATADTFIDNRMQSEISPINDAGRILDVANKGVNKTYDTVTEPMKPVLDPVRTVRDESLRVVSKVYDVLTLRHLRDKK